MKKEELIKKYPDLLKEIFIEFTNASFDKGITWNEYLEKNNPKKALFVTKDDVEIFEENKYWILFGDATFSSHIAKDDETDFLYKEKDGRVLFSTKEVLLKYRLKHARVLSYNDIVDSLDSVYSKNYLLDKVKKRLDGNS
jgi:hypothetical protein